MSFKPTLLDRAVAQWDPVRGVQRMRARLQMEAATTGFSALSDTSNTDGGPHPSLGRGDGWMNRFRPATRSAAADTLPYARTLRGQSRELIRKEPYAASAIGQKVQRAVGTGLTLSAQPHRDVLGLSDTQRIDWGLRTHAEFSLFADSTECDLYRTLDFYDQQPLALRSILESGDAFTLLPDGEPTATMPYALRLQVLEADRVGNPMGRMDTREVAGGIRRNAQGAPLAAHVYAEHPGDQFMGTALRYTGEWVDFVGTSGRRRLLHHFAMLRPEQPRGVPDLAPVMALFKLFGDYKDASLKRAIAQSFLALLIETPGGNAAPVFGVQNADPNDPTASQVPPQHLEMGPAAVMGLAPNEKPHMFDPTAADPSFGPFVQCILDEMGAGTQIGAEMLARKYNTSYTAARAAFLDAWQHLRGWRRLIARGFCQPVYETWLAEAVMLGRVKCPGFFKDPLIRWAWSRAVWNGDSQGSLNPKDEVAAYRDAVDARLLSRERAEFELFGTDWSETYATKKAEHQRLEADGMLPVPKAGAAAPQQGQGGDGGEGGENSEASAANDAREARAEHAATTGRLLSTIEALAQPPVLLPTAEVSGEPSATDLRFAELTAAVAALAAREAPPAPAPAPITITLPAITVQAGDQHLHMPEGMVTLEASVQPHIHMPPRQAVSTTYQVDPATGDLRSSTSTPSEI